MRHTVKNNQLLQCKRRKHPIVPYYCLSANSFGFSGDKPGEILITLTTILATRAQNISFRRFEFQNPTTDI